MMISLSRLSSRWSLLPFAVLTGWLTLSSLAHSIERDQAAPELFASPEMSTYVREFRALLLKQDESFTAALLATGVYDLLGAVHLRQDRGFTKARATLQRARQLVVAQEREMLAAQIELARATLPESIRADYIRGFKDSFVESRRNGTSQFVLHEKIFAEYEQAIELLATSQGWKLQGDVIEFHDRGLRRKYGKQLEAIDSLLQTAQELRQRSLNRLGELDR